MGNWRNACGDDVLFSKKISGSSHRGTRDDVAGIDGRVIAAVFDLQNHR